MGSDDHRRMRGPCGRVCVISPADGRSRHRRIMRSNRSLAAPARCGHVHRGLLVEVSHEPGGGQVIKSPVRRVAHEPSREPRHGNRPVTMTDERARGRCVVNHVRCRRGDCARGRVQVRHCDARPAKETQSSPVLGQPELRGVGGCPAAFQSPTERYLPLPFRCSRHTIFRVKMRALAERTTLS
jgi:hypothetical protein